VAFIVKNIDTIFFGFGYRLARSFTHLENKGTNIKIPLEPGKNGMPVRVHTNKRSLPANTRFHTHGCRGHNPLHTVYEYFLLGIEKSVEGKSLCVKD